MAVVGGRAARSMSTCLVPGGTLLMHSSSFSNMFSTGTDRLRGSREACLHVSCTSQRIRTPTMSVQGSHLQIYLPGRFKTFSCGLTQYKSGKTHTEHIPHTLNCSTSHQSFMFTLTYVPNLKTSDPI